MELVVNAIIYFVLFILVIYLAFKNMILRRSLNNEISQSLQIAIDKNIIMSEYRQVLQALENKKLEESEDFVKFLSDTRERAFDYIEDAQMRMVEFDKVLKDVVEWNNTYGRIIGDIPHAGKIEELSLAYDKIRELLPEAQTPNN